MEAVNKQNLEQQMLIFQECGLLNGKTITNDGEIVYKFRKYIEHGNIIPPYNRNFYRIGEFNVILKVLIRLRLVNDTMSGFSVSQKVLNFIEFIDKSYVDGREMQCAEI